MAGFMVNDLGHQMRRCAPAGLALELDVGKRLPVGMKHCPSFMLGSSTDEGGETGESCTSRTSSIARPPRRNRTTR